VLASEIPKSTVPSSDRPGELGKADGGSTTGGVRMMTNRSNSRRSGTLALAACAVIAGSAGLSWGSASAQNDPYANLPQYLDLNATIRDFKAQGTAGGHNDFQAYSGSTTVGLVNDQLDSDGKPVPKSLRGQLIKTEFKNKAGKNINPALYNADLGDQKGSLENGSTSNGIFSFDSFNQWYRDDTRVNVSKSVPIRLVRQSNSNRYVFDSATDEPYKSRGGFFPINGELFGNSGNNSAGLNSNFHFTTEVETEFVFERNKGQVFTFTGDDDVWVFIEGRLVIDLGGLHSKKEQTLDLDRLSWLEDGMVYNLKVFHAERRTNQSNFRIETTLKLRAVDPPVTTALFD
jgi:fibro-slime domain-containing protein